jgi:hypothetical protein
MTGSIHMAYMLPLCHLTVTVRFFQSNHLGLLAKIYPLLGFEPLIEYAPETPTSIPTYYVHITRSLENPLLGFFSLQHMDIDKLPWINAAALITNTCRVWLPS